MNTTQGDNGGTPHPDDDAISDGPDTADSIEDDADTDAVEEVGGLLPGGSRLDGPTANELSDEAGGPLQVP